MNRWNNHLREVLCSNVTNPFFSSTLLDKIYHSTDEGANRTAELKSYRETTAKQPKRGAEIRNRAMEEETTASSLRLRCLLDKWMEKVGSERRHSLTGFNRKSKCNHRCLDHDQDVSCYSSTSCFSDSSSGGFSSSDTEPMYRKKSQSSCFAHRRPKPMRTSLSSGPEKSEKVKRRQSTLFYEQEELHSIHDDHHSRRSEHISKYDEGFSQSFKIDSNRKNAKQPISPGARIKNFLTSMFTAGSTKKIKTASSNGGCETANTEREMNSAKASTSTRSSATSLSRSCLSKHSPATRENLRNRTKRSVQFYPVSVIVDEDCRPCGHKCLRREEDNSSLLSVPAQTARKIGWSPTRKKEEDLKLHVVENRRRVEQTAKEFLKEYHQNQNKQKNELNFRYWLVSTEDEDEDDDEDEDAASCSSSDLFELDHLNVAGNFRYSEELPVYETTHVATNRAIAKGFVL